LIEGRKCFAGATEHKKDIAIADERRDSIGCGLDRLSVALERLLVPLKLGQNQAAVAERHGTIGLNGQYPFETCECFLGAIEHDKRIAAADKRLDIVRLDRKRLIEGRERLRQAIELHQGITAIVERAGKVRLDGERLVEDG